MPAESASPAGLVSIWITQSRRCALNSSIDFNRLSARATYCGR